MAGRRKRKKGKKGAARRTSRGAGGGRGWMEEGLRALWPPARRCLPWLAAALAAAALVGFGAAEVRRRVRSRGRFLIDPGALVLREEQRIGSLRVPVVVRPVGLRGRLSALDRGVAATLAAAFGRHPWVERVRSLKVAYPNRVQVELAIRRPVAAVRLGEEYVWVDREGVRLPGVLSRRSLEAGGLVCIEGATRPVPEVGRPWSDPGVRAAAEIALFLGEDARAFDITAIDVSNINGRIDYRLSEIVLLTAHRTRILWGRPPESDRLGELAPGEKLRLLRLAAARGMLNGPGEVDVRFPNQAIGRPPPAASR